MINGRKISELDALSALLGTHKFIVADGAETYSVLFSALRAAIMPPGTKIDFCGATAPDGFLACDGAAVSRTTYAALFAAIGTTWGAGDGSTTFNLPDLRESVEVGAGTRDHGGDVAAHDEYSVGQFKDDQTQSHIHDGAVITTYLANSASGGSGYPLVQTVGTVGSPAVDGSYGTPRIGAVTHGKQTGVLKCIKY